MLHFLLGIFSCMKFYINGCIELPTAFPGFGFEEWFLPTLAAIGLRCISWEELLAVISDHNEVDGRELGDFYAKCIEFNKKPKYIL